MKLLTYINRLFIHVFSKKTLNCIQFYPNGVSMCWGVIKYVHIAVVWVEAKGIKIILELMNF